MKGCRPLTDAEIKTCLASLAGNTHSMRDRALFLLGIRSGFRISELLSLRIEDVYQNGNYADRVTVAKRNMKKKRESRTVPIHPEAMSALKPLIDSIGIENPKAFLFQSQKGGKRLHRGTAWHLLKKAYIACGMTGKVACHSMRKTFAKRVYEKLGRDLIATQKAMGHLEITSTASYLSFADEEIDDAILKS